MAKKQIVLTVDADLFGVKLTGDEQIDRLHFIQRLAKDLNESKGPAAYVNNTEIIKVTFTD